VILGIIAILVAQKFKSPPFSIARYHEVKARSADRNSDDFTDVTHGDTSWGEGLEIEDGGGGDDW